MTIHTAGMREVDILQERNMSEADADGHADSAIRHRSADVAALGVADWLGLAAAPTFAIMALLTAVLGNGQPEMLCSGMQDESALGGMVLMYALMSAFHSAPWLKLIFGRRSGSEWRKSGPARQEPGRIGASTPKL